MENRLLRTMTPSDFALLGPHLRPVSLSRGQVLEKGRTIVQRAYFLESGIATMVAHTPDHQVAFAVIGTDGMTGVGAVLGSGRSTEDIVVQSAATALEISAQALQSAIGASAPLHLLLLKYVHVLMLQASQTALVNSYGSLRQRLARWILMSHDRFQHQGLTVTHEFIAYMLAVQRPGVTQAMHELEGEGLIVSSRGHIEIRDHQGLKKVAGPAYGLCEAEYEHLIGPMTA
jgi:CRP-like cAMP-binding protein